MRPWVLLEVLVAFLPVFLLLLLGIFSWPFALADLTNDASIDKFGYLVIFGVPMGVLGCLAIYSLTRNLANPEKINFSRLTALLFLLSGFLALIALSLFISKFMLMLAIVVLPFAASLHIIYLQRGFLFISARKREV